MLSKGNWNHQGDKDTSEVTDWSRGKQGKYPSLYLSLNSQSPTRTVIGQPLLEANGHGSLRNTEDAEIISRANERKGMHLQTNDRHSYGISFNTSEISWGRYYFHFTGNEGLKQAVSFFSHYMFCYTH